MTPFVDRRALVAFAATGVVLGIALALTAPGCSKSTNPYPASGPGPGGGSTSFNFSFPATGVSQTYTFADSGTFGYHCIVHGGLGMTGTVIVSSAGADSDTVAVGVDGAGNPALRFTPSTVTVRPGGKVRWINRSTMTNHTVTSN